MSSGRSTPGTDDEGLAARAARPRSPAPALSAAQQAFEALYQRHARRLLAFLANRVPRADLEDLHQTVWIRAWEHLPDGFRGGQFRAWLYRIANNLLIDRSRRWRLPVLADADQRPDNRGQGPDAALLNQELRQLLEKCLGQLSAEQADVVRGRFGGESYEELAVRLHLATERAHSLFHKAKLRLQECVGRGEP